MISRYRLAAALKRHIPRPVRRLLRRVRTRLSPLTVLGDAGAARARGVPPLREFVTAIVPAARGSDRTQLDKCRAAFEQLVRNGALRQLVDFELENADPARTNQQFDFHRRLPIVGGLDFTLEVAFLGDAAHNGPPVAENERHMLVAAIGNARISVDRFNISGNPQWDVVDEAICAELCSTLPLDPGAAVFIERGDTCRLRAEVPGAALLVFRFGGSAAVRRHYDAQTLRASYVTSTDVGWHRLREALGVIEALNDPALIDRAHPLTAHPSHFIRWAALRAIARIAPERAKPLLEKATHDPHPQLRLAAQSLLAGADVAASHDPELSIAWH